MGMKRRPLVRWLGGGGARGIGTGRERVLVMGSRGRKLMYLLGGEMSEAPGIMVLLRGGEEEGEQGPLLLGVELLHHLDMRESTEIAMMKGREGTEEIDMTEATVEEEEVIIMKGEIEGRDTAVIDMIEDTTMITEEVMEGIEVVTGTTDRTVTAETTDRMRGMIGTTGHRVLRRRRRRSAPCQNQTGAMTNLLLIEESLVKG
jgi:hypothetical protein